MQTTITALKNKMPVFTRMKASDLYDFILLSIVDALLREVYVRCGTKYREARVEGMQDQLERLQASYPGYIEDTHKNRAEKFITFLHTDRASLLKDIKTIKGGVDGKIYG